MQRPDADRLDSELLRHGPFLRRLARSLVRDEHAAEDLVHDTWLAALRSAPAGSRDLRGWLATVLQRRATSRFRSQGRATEERYARERRTTVDSAESAALALERERLLLDAVESLDEPYRTAIYLRYREGLQPRRIAARLDLPSKTVATRLERGKAQLRRRLDSSLTDDDDPRTAWLAALSPLVAPARTPLPLLGASLMTRTALSVVSLALLGWFLFPMLVVDTDRADRRFVDPSPTEVAQPALAPAPAAPRTRTAAAAPAASRPVVPAGSGAIEVAVVDSSGEPVPACRVLVASQPPGRRNSAEWRTTGGDGRALFEGCAPGRYFVLDGTVRAHRVVDGFLSIGEHVEVAVGATEEVTLTLQPGVRVQGRVLLPDGGPAAEARLWAAEGTHADRWTTIAVADGSGRFEFVAGRRLIVQAALPSHVPSSGFKVAEMAEVEPGVRSVELVLGTAGAPLSGRVVDSAGQPIAGARVGAGPIGSTVSGAWEGRSPARVTARTDADGRFTYPFALPEVETVVTAHATGFGATVIEVQPTGVPMDVEIALHPAARLTGLVRGANGELAAEVDVVAHRAGEWIQPNVAGSRTSDVPIVRTRTDAEGRYELMEVTAGEVALQAATPRGVQRATARTDVTLAPGKEHVVDLVLDEGDVIAGQVVDRDGVPVSGVHVKAGGRHFGETFGHATTGVDGAFRLSGIETGRGERFAVWTIVARKLEPGSIRELARIEDVAVGTEDLLITVDRPIEPTSHVEGRLVAATPRVPADVRLTVWRADTNSGHFAGFDPDTGAFRYGPLAPGSYRIEARRQDEVVATRSGIEVGEGETVDVGVIVLDAGGHVAVAPRLADRHGLPAEIDGIVLKEGRATMTHEHGAVVHLERAEDRWVSTELLEPGTWTFRAEGERTLYPTIECEVSDGETTELDCLARLGHDVRVRVLLPETGWERARVTLGHADDGLVHRTDWHARGDGADPTFELTLPIGASRISVETEDGVRAEVQRETELMERPGAFEIDAR
ncbi:MAG: sigma-70 family RNA polymerase sigma factor [Planctomycetota bacterium]